MGCSLLAALAVAIDAYFSVQEGYLSLPPNYDGVGYMVFARTVYRLILGFHLHTALIQVNTIAPGWTGALAFQFLVFGAGPWQAFTVRFWPAALLLLLVYWVVRRRATRSLSIAATVLTALLPLISAGVRSSSLEFLSAQANYTENWYLDDLRPDILALALILWSVAILAEHSESPTRLSYLASAAFAAAAVLVKPSTSPLLLLAWAGTLAFIWFLNRRRTGTTRNTALAVAFLTLLLTPWAIFGGGVSNVIGYLYETAVTYPVFSTNDNLLERFAYFAVRIPTDLGQIEAWAVIAVALVVTVGLVRRSLGPAELIYGAVGLVFYLTFALAKARNAHLAEWIAAALWIYVCAGVARLAAARWHGPSPRAAPALFGAVGLYCLIVYGLGAFALVNWPANEHRSNVQLSAVTASLADELGRHIKSSDCFAYAPGPGWPGSIQFVLMDANGNAPGSTAIYPALSTDAYVQVAKKCAAAISYREDITQVAQAFYAPAQYQPYYRAVADWVHGPDSGFTLDRTWSFSDLAPYREHTLGHYQGVSLTVELYLRSTGQI